MTRRRSTIVLLAVLCGSACDSSRSSDMPVVRIGDNAISVLSPANGALWGVRDVVDLDGTLWALTAVAPHIHGFDSTGGSTAIFGANGEGPGELRFPSSAWPGPKPGSLTVWDPGSLAARTFSGEGHLLSSSDTPTLGAVRSDIATVTFGHPFRAFRVAGATVVARYDSGVTHGSDLWNGRLVLVSDDGVELAAVIDFSRELPGASQRSTAPMLSPVPLWDGCPDGRIAVLDPVARQLLMMSHDGHSREAIPLPWEPDALGDEARLAYLVSRVRAEVGDQVIAETEIVGRAAEMARNAEGLFAAEEPIAVDLKCSPEKVWIQEFDSEAHPLGYGPVWRTVALDHEPAAFSRVLFPTDFNPHRISESRAIGVVVDSVGFERLAAVKLPPRADPGPLPVQSSGSPTYTQTQGKFQP